MRDRSLQARVAVFWDKSFLWGLIAYRTFSRLGVDFDLLNGTDIRAGGLDGHDIIFVPGGWASDKIDALGKEGADAVRRFVESGGSYLGFCGGAGLALSHESGLGLAPFGRLPTSVRLPSFSGKIVLRHAAAGHPMWDGIEDGTAFFAWWPGQFALDDSGAVQVLATYGEPQPGSFVTDLPLGPDYDWSLWEKSYGINLNPERIVGEPAVVEVRYGAGSVVLSYLHFETPEDDAGHKVLLNLIEHLSGGKPAAGDEVPQVSTGRAGKSVPAAGPGPAAAIARELERKTSDFISFGKSNFLWYWRSPWLLQWRRGVRGIEYSTLYGMLAELDRMVEAFSADLDDEFTDRIENLKGLVETFLADARELLMLERHAMSHGPISPLKSDDVKINALRDRLFSISKRCGGLYEEIIVRADDLLMPLLIGEREAAEAGGNK